MVIQVQSHPSYRQAYGPPELTPAFLSPSPAQQSPPPAEPSHAPTAQSPIGQTVQQYLQITASYTMRETRITWNKQLTGNTLLLVRSQKRNQIEMEFLRLTFCNVSVSMRRRSRHLAAAILFRSLRALLLSHSSTELQK